MLYFGHKENGIDYPIRKSVYGILMKEDLIGVIETPRGYFLPGGGIEDGETHEACVKREFEEETGYLINVLSFITTNKEYGYAPGLNHHIEMIASYYHVEATGETVDQIE